jgi:hypothetical protein
MPSPNRTKFGRFRRGLAKAEAERPTVVATEGPREHRPPHRATGPLGAEWVWQNHVQQDHGKNPNGTTRSALNAPVPGRYRDLCLPAGRAERTMATQPLSRTLEPAVPGGHAIWSARSLPALAERPTVVAMAGPREHRPLRHAAAGKPVRQVRQVRLVRPHALLRNHRATGPLGAEWVWQNHVQQDHGKNPNGTTRSALNAPVPGRYRNLPAGRQGRAVHGDSASESHSGARRPRRSCHLERSQPARLSRATDGRGDGGSSRAPAAASRGSRQTRPTSPTSLTSPTGPTSHVASKSPRDRTTGP